VEKLYPHTERKKRSLQILYDSTATQKLQPVRLFFIDTLKELYDLQAPAIVQVVAIFSQRMSNFSTRPIREAFLVK
jgi:hypothetical protein